MVDFEKLLFQAKLSEAANRPEKSFALMETIAINKKEDLNAEERNILSTSYKCIISGIRASCNKINEIYIEEKRKNSKGLHLIENLKNQLELELKNACEHILDLLDKYLIPKASKQNPDSAVLYYKLKGDYNRYLAMFFTNKKEYSENALIAYNKATSLSEPLSCINPIKIDLALSSSVFHYDILKNTEEAIAIANEALGEGIEKLKEIEDSDMKETATSLQMLKNNVDAWMKDEKEKEADDI